MKTEFVDVSETRKNLNVEIESSVVDAEIDRVARDYSKAARIPGFRPGKVPPRVVKQRFRSQILHDVVHELVPRAVDDALRERGVEPVDTPDIRDILAHPVALANEMACTVDVADIEDVENYEGIKRRFMEGFRE